MSTIKDGRYSVLLDKERYLLVSLNAIDEIQDRFGAFDNLEKTLAGKDRIKNLRWLLTLLLNEGLEEGEPALDERKVGRLIHAGNMETVTSSIFKAFSVGTKGTDNLEDESKNAETGRVS